VVGIKQARRLKELALDLARSGSGIHIHCEHLHHLDCAGVQVLLALRETLKRKDIGMELKNMPDSVHQTLRTVGLASAF
jgi:anti-anti-sigma factor